MTENKTIKTDYTEGSIIQSILKMGLPSMIGFLAHHIYAMADMYWVSRLPNSEPSIAAITFITNVLWVLFSFNSLIGPGSVAIISRRYGEKDYDNTERAIKETIILKLFFGTLLGALGWYFVSDMLSFLGATGNVLDLGVSYGKILLIGLPIMYATYSFFTAMRSIANPAIAMALMIGSNILNALLYPLFIFGYWGFPELGLQGAAYASIISYSLTFMLGAIIFGTKYTNVRMHLVGKTTVSLKSMMQILKIGTPALLGEISFSGSRMLLTPLIATFGMSVVAAYGVGIQVFGFGIMLIVGIGLGLSSLIGHNLGAEKIERAMTTANQSLVLSLGILTVFGLLTYFFGEYYMSIFFDSPETIAIGKEMLQIWSFGFPAYGVFIMLEQIHSGVGHNKPFMVMSVIHGWGLQVIPALIVTSFLGFDKIAVWWIFTVSGYISAMIFYIYFRRGKWLTVKV